MMPQRRMVAKRRSISNAKPANQLGVDYLRLFPEFLQSPRYRAALLNGDKVHPADDGYAMIAEYIGDWDKWREKLKV